MKSVWIIILMKEGFSTILRVNWTFFIIYQSGERKIRRHLDVLKKYILVDPGTPYVEDVGGFFLALAKECCLRLLFLLLLTCMLCSVH